MTSIQHQYDRRQPRHARRLSAARVAGSVALIAVLSACGQPAAQQPAPANSPAPTTSAPAQTAPPTTATRQISQQQAGTIATGTYGGHVREIEADDEDDQPTWEVEIDNSRQGDIEVDVSRDTGQVVKVERSDDHNNGDNHDDDDNGGHHDDNGG